MFKHSVDKHDGEYVEFEMKVVKQHFSAFVRLIHESVRINRLYKVSVLNSKSEWGSNKLPKLVIEKDEKLDNVKGNDLTQKNDFERFGFREGSLSGCRQVGSQSSNANKNIFNSWTPSTFAQIRSGESADHRHRKTQLSMHHYFRDRHEVK